MRYYATQENGKGYLYDKTFSVLVPIAVEKTFEMAQEQARHFNELARLDKCKTVDKAAYAAEFAVHKTILRENKL